MWMVELEMKSELIVLNCLRNKRFEREFLHWSFGRNYQGPESMAFGRKFQKLCRLGDPQWNVTIIKSCEFHFSMVLNCLLAMFLSAGRQLIHLIALALNLDEDFFEKVGALDAPMPFLRLLHYPGKLEPSGEEIYGASAHSDYGMITLLATDGVPGLWVCRDKSQHPRVWEDVPNINGAFIVNIGDMMEMWTNFLFRSTLHRVMPAGQERYSAAFFLDPNYDCVVKCLESCCSESCPPRFPPIRCIDYLNERFREIGLIKVLIDAKEPLKRSLRVDLLGEGKIKVVLLRYERLLDYCFKCSRLGHSLRECLETGDGMEVISEAQTRLNVWLRRDPGKQVLVDSGGTHSKMDVEVVIDNQATRVSPNTFHGLSPVDIQGKVELAGPKLDTDDFSYREIGPLFCFGISSTEPRTDGIVDATAPRKKDEWNGKAYTERDSCMGKQRNGSVISGPNPSGGECNKTHKSLRWKKVAREMGKNQEFGEKLKLGVPRLVDDRKQVYVEGMNDWGQVRPDYEVFEVKLTTSVTGIEGDKVADRDGVQLKNEIAEMVTGDKVSSKAKKVVWCVRNAFIHERKRFNVWDTLSWSKAFLGNRIPAIASNSVKASLDRVLWKPLDQGTYKINCKAVVSKEGGWIGFGIIIRDARGLVMASCSVQLVAGIDAWAANALAILNSIQFGSECGLFPFIIESDTKRVVNGINNGSHLNSNYRSILIDIDRLLFFWRVSSVNWAPAGCNKVAHGLAMEARSIMEDIFWMEDFPRIVRREVESEFQR
ncbi:hypothetical protein EZV62_023704 [Acer yangbiense]|uniref:CCHC-type domain-containing protein n=1 Tax=Acer yangbiense TaxID=1000413 RepID=A0A5C7H2I9_9ROSI|nr:hypothetical protein EZV62_023704 [Acer yangbiense]